MHLKLVPVAAVAVTAVAIVAGQSAAVAAPRAGEVAAAALKSPDLAGYAVTPSKLISAQATIKVPSITCAPSGDSGVAPGVYLFGGYSGYSGAFVGPSCENGQVSYGAYITINGSQTTLFTAKPGNTVIVSISETASKTSATVHDVTTGRRSSLSGAGSDKTQVFVGDGGWFFGGLGLNDLGGVPRFKSYSISSVSVGGHALGAVRPVKVERVKGSTLQILPGAITRGRAFKMAFKHA